MGALSLIYMGMPDMVNRTDWWFNNTEPWPSSSLFLPVCYRPSPNYDPWENWPHELYPFHMAGGPGYLLGPDLVQAALSFMGPPISWNEDKAMGIAISRSRESGVAVRYVYLHMDDGEINNQLPFSGLWDDYPFFSQHQLSAESIACLFNLELGGSVDACYRLTGWLKEFME